MTETPFVLFHGYTDRQGTCHREGAMRPATARDETRALSDFRVHMRPESFLSVILPQVILRLGGLKKIDAGVVDRLSPADRAFLERLYREVNGYPEMSSRTDATENGG